MSSGLSHTGHGDYKCLVYVTWSHGVWKMLAFIKQKHAAVCINCVFVSWPTRETKSHDISASAATLIIFFFSLMSHNVAVLNYCDGSLILHLWILYSNILPWTLTRLTVLSPGWAPPDVPSPSAASAPPRPSEKAARTASWPLCLKTREGERKRGHKLKSTF